MNENNGESGRERKKKNRDTEKQDRSVFAHRGNETLPIINLDDVRVGGAISTHM